MKSDTEQCFHSYNIMKGTKPEIYKLREIERQRDRETERQTERGREREREIYKLMKLF